MIFSLLGTLPMRGTEIAGKWDDLYTFLVILSLFFFVGIIGAMIYFAVKFHRNRNKESADIHGHTGLEILWTAVPTILVLGIFVWGWNVYKEMVRAPSDAFEIKVLGKQWLWQFQYDDGRITTNELFVPVGKPIKLVMTSEDVLHSFFVPNFRIKQDVVPGMYTSVWFETGVEGRHQVYCAEFCGTSHSAMLAEVIALNSEDWKKWKSGKKVDSAQSTGEEKHLAPTESLSAQGKKLMTKFGCVACHTADGTKGIGPSYKGLFDHDVELADGSTVKADVNYLRESIENPNAKIVKGFSPQMPTFKGIVGEPEMMALIEYIKSVK